MSIAQIQLQTLDFAPFRAYAALQFTPSYREAQQINQEVERDRNSNLLLNQPSALLY